jgi:hypothetical protein
MVAGIWPAACMLLYCIGVMCSNPGGGTSQYRDGFLWHTAVDIGTHQMRKSYLRLETAFAPALLSFLSLLRLRLRSLPPDLERSRRFLSRDRDRDRFFLSSPILTSATKD